MAIPAGFAKADTKIAKRLIISVMGREKQGKTNFGLTAPGPIAVFDFDYGMEGVVNKFAASKQIFISEYRIHEINADKFVASWEKFKKDFYACLAAPKKEVRSIVVDTATEEWELARMARFGKLTQVMPQHYGPVNAEMRGLIRDAYSSEKSVIFLHKMSQVYINNQPTKDYALAGFKDTPYSVQVNVQCWRDEDQVFHATVLDCRQNPSINGMDIVGDMINFTTLATMIFPETSEEDWT